MLLLTVMVMDFLAGMEFDLFVPSFPELQQHFHLTPFYVEALLSVNFIGYCLSLFVVGELADRYGRKPIIVVGLILFLIGSVMCLFSPVYLFFLIGRFLQGVGVAAPAILSFLIVSDSYPLKKQQFLLAMLNGSMNLAVGIAPVLGSYITLYFHWRGNFIALLVLGIITLLMTIFFVPMPLTLNKAKVNMVNEYLVILRSRPLMLLMFNLLFTFIPYWIFVGVSPLLYIKDLGVSLAHFGYYQGVLAFLFAIGSVAFGLWIKNGTHQNKNMLQFNMKLYFVSLIFLTVLTITNNRDPFMITFALITFVMCQIIPSTILYPLMLEFMPESKGRISGLIQSIRLVLTAIGLQIAGYFYVGSFREIGMIMLVFIVTIIVTTILVIRNRELMREGIS